MNKIFIIDTPEHIQEYSVAFLQRGYLVFTGTTDAASLAELQDSDSDMILFNLENFDEADFLEFKKVKNISERGGIPLIALVKDVNNLHIPHIMQEGASDFIAYPFDEAELDSLLARHIKEKLTIDTVLKDSERFQSIADFMDVFIPLLSRHIHVEKIALMLNEHETKSVVVVKSLNISPLIVKKSKFKMMKSLIQTIRKYSKPIRTNKLFSDLRFMDISFEEKEKLLQMETDVIIPIHFMEEFQGLLTLGKKTDGKPLATRELGEILQLTSRMCSAIFQIEERKRQKENDLDWDDDMALAPFQNGEDEFSDPLVDIPYKEKESASFSIDFEIGETFAERFIINEFLGNGSLGNVYRVLDNQLDEEMVIKVFYPHLAQDIKESESLKKNLIQSRKASQKNIIPYFDFKEYKEFRYITMALVSGQTLKSILEQEHQLSFRKGIAYITQVCESLTVVHEAGLFHGNLKPNNMIIDEKGLVKLLDLGMARPFEVKRELNDEIILETAEYISPERASGDKCDQRTDIYSLGILMYRMFTGIVPFKSETAIATALLHVEQAPMGPRKFNTYIPFTLEEIIMTCLQKSPGDRFQHMHEIIDALRQLEEEKSEGFFDDEFIAVRQTDQITLFFDQGQKYFDDGLYLDCIAEMKKILSIYPQHIEATQMIEAASRELEIDPSGAISPHILELTTGEIIEKARHQYQEEKLQDCIDTIRSALRKDPDNSEALRILEEAQKKVLENEVRKHKETTKQRTKDIKRLYKEGKKLFKVADYEGCLEHMNKILELDATYSGAHKFIAKVHKKMS